ADSRGARRSRAACPRRGSRQHLDRVDGEADETADQRAVDPDILQVAPDRAFEPVRDRSRVPAADGVRDQPHDSVAIIGGDSDRCAAGEAVEAVADARVVLERRAELAEQIADLALERALGIAPAGDDPAAKPLPPAEPPLLARRIVADSGF